MFFDKTLQVRIRQEEYDKLEEYVKKDPEISNVSHAIRIAILKLLSER